ncbi:MAG: LUD domain-containing protein [Bacteroidota bacterium]|nr:LUD domain-containing protein [Bacteroidota bacterium]
MKESTSKEKILKRIRNAYEDSSSIPFPNYESKHPCFVKSDDSLDVTFAENYFLTDGRFIYCEGEDDFVTQLRLFVEKEEWEKIFCLDTNMQEVLKDCNIPFSSDLDDDTDITTGIIGCEFLIARTGSILVSSNSLSGRRMNVFPEKHVVFAFADQLVGDIKDAFAAMQKKYKDDALPSMISVISGPSRTADIEKRLVKGVHGPKELILFYIE